MISIDRLIARRDAVLGSFFRRDALGRVAEADRFTPAYDRVQRAIDRALSSGAA